MIIQIKHSDLDKLDSNKINILMQDFGYKGCSYDIILETSDNPSSCNINYKKLEGNQKVPNGFQLINFPNDLKCKTIDDVIFAYTNMNELSNNDLLTFDTINEFKLKLENVKLYKIFDEKLKKIEQKQ